MTLPCHCAGSAAFRAWSWGKGPSNRILPHLATLDSPSVGLRHKGSGAEASAMGLGVAF